MSSWIVIVILVWKIEYFTSNTRNHKCDHRLTFWKCNVYCVFRNYKDHVLKIFWQALKKLFLRYHHKLLFRKVSNDQVTSISRWQCSLHFLNKVGRFVPYKSSEYLPFWGNKRHLDLFLTVFHALKLPGVEKYSFFWGEQSFHIMWVFLSIGFLHICRWLAHPLYNRGK